MGWWIWTTCEVCRRYRGIGCTIEKREWKFIELFAWRNEKLVKNVLILRTLFRLLFFIQRQTFCIISKCLLNHDNYNSFIQLIALIFAFQYLRQSDFPMQSYSVCPVVKYRCANLFTDLTTSFPNRRWNFSSPPI